MRRKSLFLIPLAALVLFFLGVFPQGELLFPCAVRSASGVKCPGCGMTHALAALTHGEFGESMQWHPLGIPLALFMGYMWVRDGIAFFKGNQRSQWIRTVYERGFVYLFCIGLFGYWIVTVIIEQMRIT